MPPISPQGSRTGLVTALVVFVILFVATTIMWIYEFAERKQRDQRISEYDQQFAQVADQVTIGGPDVQALLQARDQPTYQGMTALQIAIAQRNQLARTVGGKDGALAQVQPDIQRGMAAVAAAGAKVPPATPLANVVENLGKALAQAQQEKAALQQQVNDAQARGTQDKAERTKLLAQKDQEIAAINQQKADLLKQVEQYQQATAATASSIQQSSTQTLASAQQQNEQLTAQLNQALASIKQQQAQIAVLQERLKVVRVPSIEPTIQKPDGEIVRLPGNNVAVINLGLGDQIVQGMTFEVYDKYTGIPALGADGTREGDMPKGKASIEVTQIHPGYSDCRIIRKETGVNLVQGDLVSNLVYDKTQKYKFFVYGDFDLNNDKRTDPNDAEVIKRLITQWGGEVVNEVNVNTDFVIMGVEPKVEAASSSDAVEMARHQREVQALDRYLDIRKNAIQLNIPILNQNRFLNFVGYTSQAAR